MPGVNRIPHPDIRNGRVTLGAGYRGLLGGAKWTAQYLARPFNYPFVVGLVVAWTTVSAFGWVTNENALRESRKFFLHYFFFNRYL